MTASSPVQVNVRLTQVILAAGGSGKSLAFWPGWYVSQRLENLHQAWFDAPDLSSQKPICAEL